MKKKYGNNVNLVYIDADSFLLEFKNNGMCKEIQNGALRGYMDLSNILSSHLLYREENKGKLGSMKSETSDNPISEVICLASKCYSVL